MTDDYEKLLESAYKDIKPVELKIDVGPVKAKIEKAGIATVRDGLLNKNPKMIAEEKIN